MNTSPTDTFSVSAFERSTSIRTCGAPARKEVTRLASADCVLALRDQVVGRVLQLDVVEAAVLLLDLHLEAAGIADALDGGRHQREGAAVLQRPARLATDVLDDRAQVLAFGSLRRTPQSLRIT